MLQKQYIRYCLWINALGHSPTCTYRAPLHQHGVTSIEYALLSALIALAAIGAIGATGSSLSILWEQNKTSIVDAIYKAIGKP